MRGRFRPTKTAKVLALLIVIVILAAIGFAGVKTGFIKLKDKEATKATASVDYDSNGNVIVLHSFRCYPNPKILQKYPKGPSI